MRISFLLCLALVVTAFSAMTSIKDRFNTDTHLATDLGSPRAGFDIDTIITNFINGASLEYIVPTSGDCFRYNLYFATNVSNAVQQFYKQHTLENFYNVMESFGTATPMIEHCFETFVDAEKAFQDYAKKFKYNPVNYIDSFKNNFQANAFVITAEFTQLYSDIESGDFNKGAYDLGQLLNHMLVFENTAKHPAWNIQVPYSPPTTFKLGIVPTNFQDFFDGYLNGTVEFNTEYNLMCANSTRWWIETVDEAITLFNKGGDKNTRQAWMYIAQSFSQLYPLTYNCVTGVEEQISAVVNHADWEQPWNIADRIGRNLPLVRQHIMSMEALIKKNDYYGAGNSIGQLVYFFLFEGNN